VHRAIELLAARRLTAYLVFSYAVFLVFLAIWGARVPTAVVVNISNLAPFWLLYLLAGAHLAACLWVFWAAVRQRCSLNFPAGGGERLAPLAVADWGRHARGAGLRLIWQEEERQAVLVRHRYSPAGSLVFHAALFLLPVALLVSRATRFKGEAWIVEGHPFSGTREEYTQVEPADAFEGRAPRVAFGVESVEAVFWGERLFFTDLRALIAVPRGDTAVARWITLPQPAWIDGARVTLRGFNYTPAFELRSADGGLLEAGDLSLRLFPTGSEDSFSLPGLPYRVWVRLYPDSQGPQADPISRGYSLRNPLLHAAVTCGKRLVGHAWLRPGEPLVFDDLRLTFPAIRRGGDILVHRDRGYPILWLALIAALAGTVARVAFPSTRVWLRHEGDSLRALARDDPFSGGRGQRFLDRLRGEGR